MPHAEVADQVSGVTVARRRYGVLVAVVDHVCAAYVDPLLLPVGVAAEGAAVGSHGYVRHLAELDEAGPAS